MLFKKIECLNQIFRLALTRTGHAHNHTYSKHNVLKLHKQYESHNNIHELICLCY